MPRPVHQVLRLRRRPHQGPERQDTETHCKAWSHALVTCALDGSIYSRPGRRCQIPVHTLVLLAFELAGFRPWLDGEHLNGDGGDNRLTNLRWAPAEDAFPAVNPIGCRPPPPSKPAAGVRLSKSARRQRRAWRRQRCWARGRTPTQSSATPTAPR